MAISRAARADWNEITEGLQRGDYDYINFFEHQVVPHSDHWRWAPDDAQYQMRESFWYQFGPLTGAYRTRDAQQDLLDRLGIDPEVFWLLWSDFYGAG